MDRTVQMEIIGFLGVGLLYGMYTQQTTIASACGGALAGLVMGTTVAQFTSSSDNTTDEQEP